MRGSTTVARLGAGHRRTRVQEELAVNELKAIVLLYSMIASGHGNGSDRPHLRSRTSHPIVIRQVALICTPV